MTKVNVVAGCMTGPMSDQTPVALTDTSLGYVAPTPVIVGLKTLTGSANIGCTVAAYSVSADTTPIYTLLGKPVIAKASTTDATKGTFTLALTTPVPSGKIEIRVTDNALNVNKADITVPGRTITLTKTIPTATTDTVATAVTVNYADSVSTMTTYLTSQLISTKDPITVTYVSGTDTVTVPLTLEDATGATVHTVAASNATKSSYSISSGKIIFEAGVLNTATDYIITATANAYSPTGNTATQTVAASTTVAPTLAGTFAATASTTTGDTNITATVTSSTGVKTAITAKANDSLVYKVVTVTSTSTPKAECLGNPLTGTTTAFVSGTDISGVDLTSNKIVDIYEINTTTKAVVSTKRITLTTGQIKLPLVSQAIAVTAPVTGAAPSTATITGTAYTATISWTGTLVSGKFAGGKDYTATIKVTPTTGYTLTGLPADYFTVTGAKSATNAAGSGTVTVTFPTTEVLATQVEGSLGTITQGKAAVIATAATGTITYGTPATGDTITVDGTTFTETTDYTDIASLTTKINALPDVTATHDATTITVTAKTAGAAGNAIALSTTSASTTVSGSTLAGGADAAAGVTETADFTVSAGATNAGTITATVNGTDHTVLVTLGETATAVATAIRTKLASDGVTGYTVTNPSVGVVRFTSRTANTNVTDITVTIAG
jgi:hypothetical protein